VGRAGTLVDGAFPRRQILETEEQRIAAALLRLVVAGSAFGIELRPAPAGDVATALHVAADPRDGAGQALADAFELPVVLVARAPHGSLAHAARRDGVPMVVLHVTADLAAARDGVLRMLDQAGLGPNRRKSPQVPRAASVTRLSSRRGGWLAPLVAPGAVVEAGDPLALLVDEDGTLLATVAAPARAFVLGLSPTGQRPPGAVIARLVKLPASRRDAAPRELHVGWCEDVALPDLGIAKVLAKIDTGARSSALHVLGAEKVGNGELELRLPGRRRARVKIVGDVVVRDSGGHDERRPVIETRLTLGPITRRIRLTLTNRDELECPMLIGRTALGQDVVVHPGARHLLRRPR
jgi:hypothetical protein